MVTMAEIEALALEIAREFHPDRIVLFGSHAYGRPRADSDVDLLVLMPFEGKSVSKACEILRKTQPRFGVDLLVRRPEDVERRLALGDFFLREVMEKGRVLYESAHV
jgi:predicted nucleotidyltransferase